jgi:hypothetical protein
VIEVQDFHRGGEVQPAQLPNPRRSVADEDDFPCASHAPALGFGAHSQAKGFGGLETADIGRGGKITFRAALLIAAGLGEDGAQFDRFQVAHPLPGKILPHRPQEGLGFPEARLMDFRRLEFFLPSGCAWVN